MVDIQEITDDILFRLINESQEIEWNFFALKVMILRLRLKLSMSGYNETTKQQCYADLRDLFRKSAGIPSAKKDLQTILEHFG